MQADTVPATEDVRERVENTATKTLYVCLTCKKVPGLEPAPDAAPATGRVSAAETAALRAEVLALERLEPYDIHAHWACDDHVHNLFINSCGNTVMASILHELHATTRLFEIALLADRLGPDSREHLAILDAIEAGDAQAARLTMSAHARSLFDFAIKTITRSLIRLIPVRFRLASFHLHIAVA